MPEQANKTAYFERIRKIKEEFEIYDRCSLYTHGYKEGCDETTHNIALKMLAKGCSFELIYEVTGLVFDEIASLQG